MGLVGWPEGETPRKECQKVHMETAEGLRESWERAWWAWSRLSREARKRSATLISPPPSEVVLRS